MKNKPVGLVACVSPKSGWATGPETADYHRYHCAFPGAASPTIGVRHLSHCFRVTCLNSVASQKSRVTHAQIRDFASG